MHDGLILHNLQKFTSSRIGDSARQEIYVCVAAPLADISVLTPALYPGHRIPATSRSNHSLSYIPSFMMNRKERLQVSGSSMPIPNRRLNILQRSFLSMRLHSTVT